MSEISALANKLHGKNRKKFWEIFKHEGETSARDFLESIKDQDKQNILRDEMVEHVIFAEDLEEGALAQFNNASRLMPARKSALMPDAHQGYGLPIGGVLALDNAISPYAIGVDIGCRMKISIFPLPYKGEKTREWHPDFKKILMEQTRFGLGAAFRIEDKGGLSQHEVLDDPAWNQTQFLKGLHETAVVQLGSSGGGNHFVEWGVVTVKRSDLSEDMETEDQYLALLSHSGSRGVGAKIADRYSKLAMSQRPSLDQSVKHLAWFDMDSEDGQEYWEAMSLAGRFAKANHDVIHKRVARAMGLANPIMSIDNHHNFAWIEDVVMNDGSIQKLYVHRKGATPAGEGVLGIIPGSMSSPGYIVRGKGNRDSINSASHGAGRAMSRKKAVETLDREVWKAMLKMNDIELIGGTLDESQHAYKNINTVMALQHNLVNIMATFEPRIVRMADDGYAED